MDVCSKQIQRPATLVVPPSFFLCSFSFSFFHEANTAKGADCVDPCEETGRKRVGGWMDVSQRADA